MIFRQKWQGRNCAEPNELFPASVPGNIQYDYATAHGFRDVMIADNYRQFLPLEDVEWDYIAHLYYECTGGERIFFVSHGIDYDYEILLNGETLYSYEGMFRPVELDLTERLTGKDDVLTVHILRHPKTTTGRVGTRDEADDSCKPPFCYGWDWNPRLLVSGMWRDAYIETRGATYIGNCEVLASLSDDLSRGTVTFDDTCAVPCERALFDPHGKEIWRGTERTVTVENPELWWCVGYGNPNRYRWVVWNEKEERSGYIGFKTLRLVRNKGAKDPRSFPKSRYFPPMTIELNGERIFAKGSNWVNPELFPGRVTAGRYEELLMLVRNANMNILRVWGGSGINKRVFYDLCDKYGILVWQEFMLSCNNYLGTPHYMKVLESEATAIIRALRSHPSLALWCGGNELFNGWSGMDDQSLPLRLLNKLCFELDRGRPFLPTSPISGVGHGGYEFYDVKSDMEVFAEIQNAHCIAYTEFGVPSITSAETLRSVIPEADHFPPEPTEAWITHHGFGAWKQDSWLCLPAVSRYFPNVNSLEELVECSAWMQTEGYRAAFEEMRRQAPYCSMAINWCFNEPWITAANNSLAEYPAKPKKAYWAVRSALRPTCFTARIEKFLWVEGETFSAELWLLNDSKHTIHAMVRAVLVVGETEYPLLEWRADAEARSNTQGPTLRFVLPESDADRIILRLNNPKGFSNEYVFPLRPKKSRKKQKLLNL